MLLVFARFLLAWGFTLFLSACACVLVLLVGPKRMWCQMAPFWAVWTLRLVGVRLHVSGGENLAGPAIFVCNHESLIDVVFMPAILPATCRFVAKRSLALIPLWGWAFAASGALLIDRSRPSQALLALRRGLKRLPAGWSLVVFPEGTRSRAGGLGRFRRGAFRMALETRLPVVPMGMCGARAVVPPNGWLVRGGDVHIHVGRPVPSHSWRPENLSDQVILCERAVADCIAQAEQAQAAARAA